MKSTAPKPFTAEDYFRLPEHGPRYQLIEGELRMSPSPSTQHQRLVRKLLRALDTYLQDSETGEVFPAPFDVKLTEHDVYQPDLCVYRRERNHCVGTQGAAGPPDLVVEVLSPATASHDRDTKRRIYAQTGVPEMWVVHPEPPILEVFRFADNPESPIHSLGIEDSLTSPQFPHFALPLHQLFGQAK